MMSPSGVDPERCYTALHQCSNAITTQTDIPIAISNLNREFNCKTIDETLSIAEKLVSQPQDSFGTIKYSQFQHDFKIIKNYSTGSTFQSLITSTQGYALFAFQYITSQRFLTKAEPESQSQELMPVLSFDSLSCSCNELIDFLHDFAPEASNGFQQKLKTLKKSSSVRNDKDLLQDLQSLKEGLCCEIQNHFVEIMKIIRFRLTSIDVYTKSGCYSKLFQIKQEVNFLSLALAKDRYFEASLIYTNVIEAFENGGAKGLDVEASKTKAIKLLAAQAQIVEKALKDNYLAYTKTRCTKLIQFIKTLEPQKLEFLTSNPDTVCNDSEADKLFTILKIIATDLLLDKMKIQMDYIQDDRAYQIQVCESWQSLLLSDPGIYMHAMDFAARFCLENEHLRKMRLFHAFLENWLEYYTPTQALDVDSLILLLKSLLLLAKSPELLLELILIEDNAIGLKPTNLATNASQDYSVAETADGTGIFYYHYLNLTTALLDICRTPSREIDELPILVKRGKLLVEFFDGLELNELFPHWIIPENFDALNKDNTLEISTKRDRLLKIYAEIKQNVEQAYWYRVLEYHIKIMHESQNSVLRKWQSCLINSPDFKAEAKKWASEFKSESNAIQKMNKHQLAIKALLQNYPPIGSDENFGHLEGLLLALVIASDDPGLITEVLFLDRNALSWAVSLQSSENPRPQDFDLLKEIVLAISKPPAKPLK